MFRDKYLITWLLIAGIAVGLIEDRVDYALVSAGFLIAMLLFERVQRDNEIGNDNVMSHIDHEVRSLQNSIDDLYRQQ
jgi:hypothetical protein|tara:strand:+ start:364 stop:597 length:234 start_codon:yes stop_codon:yes gene_type:complete